MLLLGVRHLARFHALIKRFVEVSERLFDNGRRNVLEDGAETAERGNVGNSSPHCSPANYSNCFHVHCLAFGYASTGNSRAALSYMILRCAASEIGSARNFSMLPRTPGTPGPGQSVP